MVQITPGDYIFNHFHIQVHSLGAQPLEGSTSIGTDHKRYMLTNSDRSVLMDMFDSRSMVEILIQGWVRFKMAFYTTRYRSSSKGMNNAVE